jgi:hypothetical protein
LQGREDLGQQADPPTLAMTNSPELRPKIVGSVKPILHESRYRLLVSAYGRGQLVRGEG